MTLSEHRAHQTVTLRECTDSSPFMIFSAPVAKISRQNTSALREMGLVS